MTSSKRLRRLQALNNQIDRLDRRLNDLKQRENLLSHWRLGSFTLLFLVGGAIFVTWGALAWAIASLVLLVPFALTVRWHREIEGGINRHEILRDLKQVQAARMALDWEHLPPGQPVHVEEDHPFAADLDLIGNRSLLRVLDVSITKEGGQRLCDWLLEIEPNPKRTADRQTLVSELIRMQALRDRLILNASLASGRIDEGRFKLSTMRAGDKTGDSKWSGELLLQWLGKDVDTGSLRLILLVLMLMVPLNLILLAGFINGLLPPIWLASWFVYGAIMVSQSPRTSPLFQDAAYLNDSLRRLAGIFNTLERRSFEQSPALKELLLPITEDGRRPSEQLGKANRLLSAAGLRFNPFVALLVNAVVPWDVFIAYRLGIFKKNLVLLLPGWLDIWYRLEALSGLANFGILFPDATFATFVELEADDSNFDGYRQRIDKDHVPAFDAINLGHPLIAEGVRVHNDFTIKTMGTLLIVTGSNMSGKSTFLRSIGVNICLAQAGAPVLADSLRLVPFRIGASITVSDSLIDGFSYFYAEVRRLKALLDSLQQPHRYPLFFLVDEIFRGTNNRERLIGSRAYVGALAGCFGVGIIATHDLELVKLAEAISSIHNAHFRDDIDNGRMVFDYKLRQGPCPTTNALKIMRQAGLPVDDNMLAEIESA